MYCIVVVPLPFHTLSGWVRLLRFTFMKYSELIVVIAGVRQIVTGLAELKRKNAEILCTSMCIGSGMGAAAIFVNERVKDVSPL